MPQKKKTTNKKSHKKKHVNQNNQILFFNQFQITVLHKLQDIKIIKMYHLLQQCNNNHGRII